MINMTYHAKLYFPLTNEGFKSTIYSEECVMKIIDQMSKAMIVENILKEPDKIIVNVKYNDGWDW